MANCKPEMDANKMPIPPRDLTYFEKELFEDWPRWFLRDFMINTGVDEELAKAIFNRICSSQNTDIKHLRQLTIQPLESWYSGMPIMLIWCDFLEVLAATCTVRHGMTGLVTSRQAKMPTPYRVSMWAGTSEYASLAASPRRMSRRSCENASLSTFKSIWPWRSDDTAWPYSWHSWPLDPA